MPGTKGRSGGRNRKSRRLHILTGTFQPSRHAGREVEAPGGVPAVPATLSGAALQEWHRVVEQMQAQGTLSRCDGLALEHYCLLAADAGRLQADADALARTWYEKTSVDGAGVEHVEPKLHPVFAQLRSYRMAMRLYLAELGLTPVARTRVTPQTPKATHPLDRKKQKYLDAITKPSA